MKKRYVVKFIFCFTEKKDYSRKNQNNCVCWEALNNKYDCIACNEIRIINTKHDQGRTFTNNICV